MSITGCAPWATGHGIAGHDADRYVRGLFEGVGRSLSDGTRSLHRLAADHETPNGINHRIRTTWFDPADSEALRRALDDLLADLNQPGNRAGDPGNIQGSGLT